jgi:hypothetical protein
MATIRTVGRTQARLSLLIPYWSLSGSLRVARHTDGATPVNYRWTVSTVPMRGVPEGLPYLIGRPLPGEAR